MVIIYIFFAYLKIQNFQFKISAQCVACQFILIYLGTFCMETKQNVYIYFGIVINLVHTILFAIKNVLKICRITLPLNARG